MDYLLEKKGILGLVWPRAISIFMDVEPKLFLLVLASLLWLIAHSYGGIYHDAIIYSLLAARWLYPDGFANDLFFIFGSQDDFSFYTPVFATLVSYFGLDIASRLVVLIGGVLWITAFYYLAKNVFDDPRPVAFVVLVAALVSWSYSPNFSTFELNENFATARIIAMPISLFSLAVAINGRRLLSIGLACLSAAFHPLLGVWALILVLCWRWSSTVIALGAFFAFVILIATPLLFPVGRLSLMSQEWLEMVKYSSMDVFFGEPSILRIERVVYSLSALLIGGAQGKFLVRPLYRILALMLVSLYLLSLLASYYFPVTFLLQAQPWRVMWLAMALGIVAAIDGLWGIASRGRAGTLLCGFLVLFALGADGYRVYLVGIFSLLIINEKSLCMLLAGTEYLLGKNKYLYYLIGGVVLISLPGYFLDVEMLGLAKVGPGWLLIPSWVRGFFFEGGAGLGLIFWVFVCNSRYFRWSAWFVVLPLLAFSFTNWDQRSKARYEEESNYLDKGWKNPFSQFVEQGAVVVWPRGDLRVWFELNTANYANITQAVGIVFSEQKAMEAKKRLVQLIAASIENSATKQINSELAWGAYRSKLMDMGRDPRNIHEARATAISPEGATYLCQQGGVDWVVLDQGVILSMPNNVVASYSDSSTKWLLVKCVL